MESAMAGNDARTVVTPSANQVEEGLSKHAEPVEVDEPKKRRELAELRAELDRLQSLIRQRPTSSPKSIRSAASRTPRKEIEYQIRLQPLASVALAAVVGFIYGIAR